MVVLPLGVRDARFQRDGLSGRGGGAADGAVPLCAPRGASEGAPGSCACAVRHLAGACASLALWGMGVPVA
eukprot:16188775-Heterocapsa_arctica.AAC.1